MDDSEIQRLRRQLRANPGSLQFVALGEALRSRGRLQEARTVLEQGLLRHPEVRSGQSVLARVLAGLGERGAALRLLERLVPDDPTNAALGCLAVELFLAEGALAQAAELLDRLEAVAPADSTLRRLRGQLQARRQALRQGDLFLSPALAFRLEAAGRSAAAARTWEALAMLEDTDENLARAQAARERESTAVTLVLGGIEGEGGRTEVGRLRRWLSRLARTSHPPSPVPDRETEPQTETR